MEIKKIFTLKLATELARQGFHMVGIEPNRQKPWLNVYLFKDSEYLQRTMTELHGMLK